LDKEALIHTKAPPLTETDQSGGLYNVKPCMSCHNHSCMQGKNYRVYIAYDVFVNSQE